MGGKTCTHSWFGQLLDQLDLRVRHDVVVAQDVWAVPLVLLLHRSNHELRVAVVVKVTTKHAALPPRSLRERVSE